VFLSFSLVFCRLGGRLGPTLYIHFTRRWVISMRRSSALRESEYEKKAERYAILRSAERRAWGAYVEFINRPVQLTVSASPGPAPSRVAYTASPPPRLSRPPLRLVYARREIEQADALCLHKCAATASASLSIKKRHAGSVWGLMQVYIAGDGCCLSSGLTHLSPHLSNLKPSLLHVSRYLLNCLLSIGAVLFT
jgi:hypothetical protein